MADVTLERWRANARREALVEQLHSAVEIVLLEFVDMIDKPPGEQDPDLAEFADIYRKLTGFDPLKEAG